MLLTLNRNLKRIIIILVILAAAVTVSLFIREKLPDKFKKFRAGAGAPVYSETRMVTNTSDIVDGICDADCSLRDALAVANPGALIEFDGGGQGVHQLESKLSITKNNIMIDGGEDHTVILRGRLAENVANNMKPLASFDCIELKGSDNVIAGLVIQNCRYGIMVSGTVNRLPDGTIECVASAQKNRITNNYIGTNDKGDETASNYTGVAVSRATENVIGLGNVISGNMNNGIGLFSPLPCVAASPGNRVEGNIIGLSSDGSKVIPNLRYGIEMVGAMSNIIGGESIAQRNIISGNKNGEISIYYGAKLNQIVGNYIGLDASGKKGLHDATGINLGTDNDVAANKNTTYNRIFKNFIGDNNPGIRIRGANTSFNVIEGNVLGLNVDHEPLTTNIDGTDHHPGTGFGILVEIGATQNTIGGDTKEKANIISQLANGIRNEVQTTGNKLGINSFFENTTDGIVLVDASANNGIEVVEILTAQADEETGEDQITLKGDHGKPGALVDLYVSDDKESCEGKEYIGTTFAGADGTWASVLEGPFNDAGALIVAIQQNAVDGFSEFSECFEMTNFGPQFQDPGQRGTTEKQELSFLLKAVDANGDVLDYSCAICPNGFEVDSESGMVSWTPPLGTHGQHQATFSVTDGMLTEEISVSIVVEALDTTPQLAGFGNSEVFVNTNIAFELTAPDEDGDVPRFKLVTGLEEGMKFDEATGAFSWTPGKNFLGSYTVVFRALDNDKDFLFTEKELSLKVQRKFGPPIVEIEGEKIVNSGGVTRLTAKAIGPVEGIIPYTYSWKVHEGKGTLDQTNIQEVQYQAPEVDQNVEESVAVIVEDNEGNLIEKIISLAVLAKITVDDLPTLPDSLEGEFGMTGDIVTDEDNATADEDDHLGGGTEDTSAEHESFDQGTSARGAPGCGLRRREAD